MLLADLGADVIKVEPPEGDATRGWGPPWVGTEADGTRTAAYFLAVNRNKRSHPARPPADPRARRSCAGCSPARTSWSRTSGPASLDAARLRRRRRSRALNPRLVHLAITGYGPAGPDADRPGYDFVIQAEPG